MLMKALKKNRIMETKTRTVMNRTAVQAAKTVAGKYDVV
jgi:hypothetical protein